jgi:hypothetical protein
MSDKLDNPNPFGIQSTSEMGMGDAQLLNDLLSPETASGNPDDIEPIVNEVDPPKEEVNNAPPKGKDITPPSNVDGKTEKDKLSGKSMIADFLSGSDDDDDNNIEEQEEDVDNTKSKQEASLTEEEEEEIEGSQFSALANDLFNLGVFTKDSEDEEVSISTPEEFLERFNAEKKKGASEMIENFLTQFGEDYKQAFESIFVKGVDPKEYFGAYDKVVSFSEMDLSNENNQMSIMRQALSDQGFDSEDIDTEIERLQNYGDLETVATRHHKVLVKKEAKKLQEMELQAEQLQQQKAAIKNQYVSNVQTILSNKLKEKEFDGIPLNPQLANELQDFLLVDKWKTPQGETLSDFDRTILDLKRPENHETKVKVALLLKILEKDPTLSTIQRKGVTKQSNKIFNEVARQVKKTSSTNAKPKQNSWFV